MYGTKHSINKIQELCNKILTDRPKGYLLDDWCGGFDDGQWSLAKEILDILQKNDTDG